MKRSGLHMAIVVDEYGSVEGSATVTDILETIAGDFPDQGEEDDAGAVRREDGSWLVNGGCRSTRSSTGRYARPARRARLPHARRVHPHGTGHVPRAGERS